AEPHSCPQDGRPRNWPSPRGCSSNDGKLVNSYFGTASATVLYQGPPQGSADWILFTHDGFVANPAFNFLDQGPLFYRLGNIGIRSYIKRRLPVLVTGSRRHDNNRCLLRLRSAAQPLNHFIAIELRHLKIGDDQPIILYGGLTETFFSVHRRIDFISGRLQHP